MTFDAKQIVSEINFDEIKKHPNILIAARFWSEERYRAATVCYKFMRKIDDMIDNRKAETTELSECEKVLYIQKIDEWVNCLGLTEAIAPQFDEVVDVVKDFEIPLEIFNRFAGSMFYDINNNGFETFEQFINYSEGASVSPAAVFVHLCCLNTKNKPYVVPGLNVVDAARPCAMFSYIVHIIRDFQADQNNNLNYFAIDILKKYGLNPKDLRLAAKTGIIPDVFRNVIAFYMQHAEKYRLQTEQQIEKLAPYLEPQYLLSLEIIYQLYKQVYDRIDVSNGTFTKQELNPSPREIEVMVNQVVEKESVLSCQTLGFIDELK